MCKRNTIIRFFSKLSKDHLLLLQSIQTGSLMGASDIIAQTVVEKKSLKQVNFVRTLQFASVGFLYVVSTFILIFNTILFSHNMLVNFIFDKI